jgi:membrane-bound acyltransferase YfiQ involved in biofilm formation
MNIIRGILIVLAILVFILIVVFMDKSDLSWAANKRSYLGMMACLVNLWALIFIFKKPGSHS